jgi:hypothetical protein
MTQDRTADAKRIRVTRATRVSRGEAVTPVR